MLLENTVSSSVSSDDLLLAPVNSDISLCSSFTAFLTLEIYISSAPL